MAIEIYIRDVNSSEGYLLHTAETVDEVRATVSHIKESSVYTSGSDSTREISTQYVVDSNSAYFEIVVG